MTIFIVNTNEDDWLLKQYKYIKKLDSALEEKITKEVNNIMKSHTVVEEIIRCNKHFCDYDGMTIGSVKS